MIHFVTFCVLIVCFQIYLLCYMVQGKLLNEPRRNTGSRKKESRVDRNGPNFLEKNTLFRQRQQQFVCSLQ